MNGQWWDVSFKNPAGKVFVVSYYAETFSRVKNGLESQGFSDVMLVGCGR